MRCARVVLAAWFMSIAAQVAAAQQPTQTPSPAQPTTPSPAGQQPPAPGQTTPGQPAPGQPPSGTAAPAQPAQPRTFTAPVGLLFNTVRPDRVDDFEKAMGYLQDALASSTDARVRAQAAGWRIFKANEAAPGGVLYVFLLDPTVAGADYSLSRILADAYPDEAKLREIWKLYSGSVTAGTLLNLTPVKPAPQTATTPAIEKP
jgi:hypothetical protein